MSNDDGKIPKSRTSSLLAMATKVALKEGKALFQSQAEKRLAKMMSQADIVVDHVGRLKGAAMKAVQMITIEAQDFLPPEVLQILEKLQSQAPPLSNEMMLEHLKSEIGESLFQDFDNLSAEPLAAASIGQVYEAELSGEPIVIKIQYPGVADSVDSDLKTLKKLVKTLLFLSQKAVNIDELFEEVLRVLKLETNFLNEAKNLEAYGKAFEGDEDYIIPKVYPRYSTEKVLVLSKEAGLEFSEWVKTNPSREQKEKVGQSLLNLYIKEFFQNRLVQTDPNPANFLINDKQQLVLLDFGATVSYSDNFVKDYQDLINTVFTGRGEEILQKMLDLGFISAKESKDTKQDFVSFIKMSLLPFDEAEQPFDFSRDDYTMEIREKALKFSKKIKYSAPPKQIIFLHRKLGGIFQLLRKLGVQSDLTRFRQLLLDKTF